MFVDRHEAKQGTCRSPGFDRIAGVESVPRAGQRRALCRSRAVGPPRQPLEAPERDDTGLAAFFASELLVTEHETPAPERRQGRRTPAMRTDQREIPCAPAQHKMSQPVHASPFMTSRLDRRSRAEHSCMTRQSGKTSNAPCSLRMAAAATSQMPRWNREAGTACSTHSSRGSPTMNGVPRRGRFRPGGRLTCSALPDSVHVFRNFCSFVSDRARSSDSRERSKSYRQISLVPGI